MTRPRSDYKEIPSTKRGPELRQWLDQHYLRTSRNNYERLILHCSLQGKPEDLLETVQIAHQVCQLHGRSRKRWMRIFFIFDPESTWNWLFLPQQRREEIEDKVDVVTLPRRWNRVGVRQRLNQQGKMDSDEVGRAVLKATGGWPWLLDKLFEHCGAQDDPRPAAESIKQALGGTHSQLFQDFERSLGLNDVTVGILKFIKTQQTDGQEVPVKVLVDLIVQEHIEGSPVLSEDECYAAIEYLRRMSCIELKDNDNLLSVEPTVLRLF